jgi:CRP-like cAMP-binding protein
VDVYDRLRQLEILTHFNNPQLELLAECASRQRFLEGEKILEEGSDNRDMFLVDRGAIKVQRETPYGVFTLAELGVGSLFGETSFVDGSPRSGDAIPVESATVLTLKSGPVRETMERDQRFALAIHWMLWKSLSKKLRSTNETLAHFFSKSKAPPSLMEKEKGNAQELQLGVGARRELFQEQKLSPMEINFLATLSKEMRFAAGDYIFREGDEGDLLYIVLDGKVMISKIVVDSGEEALAFLERGDYFGEMALIDGKPRSAYAKAHDGGAVVLAISRKVLEGLLDPKKVSSLRLLTILSNLISKRLREIDTKLVSWFIFNSSSGESLQSP